eukprot:9678-Eustigmatos_ZCMA.PRE.1
MLPFDAVRRGFGGDLAEIWPEFGERGIIGVEGNTNLTMPKCSTPAARGAVLLDVAHDEVYCHVICTIGGALHAVWVEI